MKKNDELLLKLMLTLARDRQAMQGRIRSVGFMREYLTLPGHLGVHTLTQMNEQQIEELATSVSIKVKSEVAKFHFYLNDTRYHVLQSNQNRIPIVTSIGANELLQYEEQAGVSKGLLASHMLANDGPIPLEHIDPAYISKLLSYMMFLGTANGPSIHQAEGLFIFEDPLNMNSWTVMAREQALAHALKRGYIERSQQGLVSIYMAI